MYAERGRRGGSVASIVDGSFMIVGPSGLVVGGSHVVDLVCMSLFPWKEKVMAESLGNVLVVLVDMELLSKLASDRSRMLDKNSECSLKSESPSVLSSRSTGVLAQVRGDRLELPELSSMTRGHFPTLSSSKGDSALIGRKH